MAKHRLVVWPNGANPPAQILTFKCVKCTRGIINLGTLGVRGLIAGDPHWRNWLKEAAFGSWGICPEDNPQLLEQFEAWRSEQPTHHPFKEDT
jgi:hypothetical protein